MKGQVLAVDFEKRELKDTQHKSENDKQSFYINKNKICNDAVTNRRLADMLLAEIEDKVVEEI